LGKIAVSQLAAEADCDGEEENIKPSNNKARKVPAKNATLERTRQRKASRDVVSPRSMVKARRRLEHA